MVGGPEEAYAAAKLIFLAMGKNIVYCGGSRNSSATKVSIILHDCEHAWDLRSLSSWSEPRNVCHETDNNIQFFKRPTAGVVIVTIQFNKWSLFEGAEHQYDGCLPVEG